MVLIHCVADEKKKGKFRNSKFRVARSLEELSAFTWRGFLKQKTAFYSIGFTTEGYYRHHLLLPCMCRNVGHRATLGWIWGPWGWSLCKAICPYGCVRCIGPKFIIGVPGIVGHQLNLGLLASLSSQLLVPAAIASGNKIKQQKEQMLKETSREQQTHPGG